MSGSSTVETSSNENGSSANMQKEDSSSTERHGTPLSGVKSGRVEKTPKSSKFVKMKTMASLSLDQGLVSASPGSNENSKVENIPIKVEKEDAHEEQMRVNNETMNTQIKQEKEDTLHFDTRHATCKIENETKVKNNTESMNVEIKKEKEESNNMLHKGSHVATCKINSEMNSSHPEEMDDEKRDWVVEVKNVDRSMTESDIREIFDKFNCAKIMVGRHSAVLYLKDESTKKEILAQKHFTVKGKTLVCEDMSRVYISNIPINITFDEIKAALEEKFREANVNVKKTACDIEKRHCGHVSVSADAKLLQDLVKKPEYHLWDRQLHVYSYTEFHRKFTLMMYGLAWRLFQMRGCEPVLFRRLKELGCGGNVIFLCWRHPEIVFEKQEDLEKALAVNGENINGVRLYVRRYKQTPHFVAILSIPEGTTEEEFWAHFSGVNILNLSIQNRRWELELKDEPDLMRCLSLHQTELNGERVHVKILSKRQIEDFFPTLLKRPYYYRNYDFVKDKLIMQNKVIRR